jgi:phosphoribosyl 1,2-cyclic phosphodiesterase
MTSLSLTFLGTRGGIRIRSRRHHRHSALLIEHRSGRLVIDCGSDWRGRIDELAPDAILVTHAHPDHAGGLVGGAPCPVYASPVTCRALATLPVTAIALATGSPVRIAGLAIESIPVVHSVIAPAVGYRIDGRVFYVPDVVDLHGKRSSLHGIELYIGDGARLIRPLVRKTMAGRRFGHTSIRTQLGWCAAAGVRRAVFTHCGTEVVAGGRRAEAVVRALGETRGIDAALARDGLVLEL